VPAPEATDVDALINEFPRYWEGFVGTLRLSLFAAVGAVVIGTLLAAFRVSPVPPLRWIGTAWVTVFRNSPLAVMLFVFAFALPLVGVKFPTFGGNAFFWPGVTALACYTAAFVCEAVRSGINAVPPGQAEAARAVGLTFQQTLGAIVLPQALRTVVPPLGSVIIAMIKNSAIVGVSLGLADDLLKEARIVNSATFQTNEVFFWAAVGYLLLTIPATFLVRYLEARFAIRR
jgi:glutamate transport system permease protein